MASIPITTRLPDWMDREIRGYWERQGVKPSPGYRRTIEEWWVSANLSLLEFREGVSGRRAGVRGGPDVWEVALVARELDDEGVQLEDHFGGRLSREATQDALRYIRRFPEAIADQLRENERVGQVLAGQA